MNYDEWASIKIGDRVKRIFNSHKGTIISDVGIGYVVKWDKSGKTERVTDGMLSRIS